MTSRSIFVALLLLAACRREPAAPAAPQTAGTASTQTVVAEPKDLTNEKVDTTVSIPPPPVSRCEVKPRFAANEPIDFTMHLTEAPAELQVSVRVMQGEKEITAVRAAGEGKKTVTLRIPKLDPGRYRLEGVWGGNLACEEEIEVK